MAIKLHFTNKKIVNNILFNINLVRIHQYNRFFIEIIKKLRVLKNEELSFDYFIQ